MINSTAADNPRIVQPQSGAGIEARSEMAETFLIRIWQRLFRVLDLASFNCDAERCYC